MTEPADVPEMTDAATPALRDARRAWILGGALLTAYAVMVLVLGGYPGLIPGAAGGVLLDLLWAAALLVLALGVRRAGSVVARRPLGVVALAVAAAVPFASMLLWTVVPPDPRDNAGIVMLGQGLMVLSLAALVVAGVVIGRAGAVPPRVRWLPLIVIAVAAAAQIAVQIVVVAAGTNLAQPELVVLVMGAPMLGTLGALLLGILTIVFAPRDEPRRDGPVQVYPPAR